MKNKEEFNFIGTYIAFFLMICLIITIYKVYLTHGWITVKEQLILGMKIIIGTFLLFFIPYLLSKLTKKIIMRKKQ